MILLSWLLIWGLAAHASEQEAKALAAIRVLDAKGKLTAAADELPQLAKSTDPDIRNEAWYFIAKIYVELKRSDDAEKIWLEGIQRLQAGADLWTKEKLALGQLYAVRNDQVKATVVLQDIVNQRAHGRAAFDAALQLGKIFDDMNEPRKAVHAYEFAQQLATTELYGANAGPAGIDAAGLQRSLDTSRRSADVAEKGEDEVLFKEAEWARTKRLWQDARTKYFEVFTRFPKSPLAIQAQWRAAECLVGLGKLEEAQTQLGLFIARDGLGPWRGQAMVSLGELYLEQRLDAKSAIDCFQNAYRAWLRRRVKIT
ncbi:MAG: tetratricopeptide repeat protein [Planctomycetes bacterium]|nr:tetratricopeptide repeat protein [Planctomycetota bacterium]